MVSTDALGAHPVRGASGTALARLLFPYKGWPQNQGALAQGLLCLVGRSRPSPGRHRLPHPLPYFLLRAHGSDHCRALVSTQVRCCSVSVTSRWCDAALLMCETRAHRAHGLSRLSVRGRGVSEETADKRGACAHVCVRVHVCVRETEMEVTTSNPIWLAVELCASLYESPCHSCILRTFITS